MRDNAGLIIFLTIAITIICSGFVYFYMKFTPNMKNAILCSNEDSTISFLVNDDDKSVVMAGKLVDSQTINIFNETAIAMSWTNNKEGTKIFLDRIAGLLEIETTPDSIEWEKEEFECRRVSIRL